MSAQEPTLVSFEVQEGQVWIDRDATGWRVQHVDGDTVYLERTVTRTVAARDLVRAYHLPNDAVDSSVVRPLAER